MPSDTDTESEQSAPELLEDEENRLSDDEEFPISEDEMDEDLDEDEEIDEGLGLKGWAGSMAKVLKSEQSSVLSKAKKVEDVAKKKEKKPYAFEIDGEDGSDEEKPDQTALERALEKRKYRERREVSVDIMINSKVIKIFCLLEQTSRLQFALKTFSG